MSSLRNAAQRRQHRERAQPVERQKHGLLEKHKDYSKRAKDFNEKKARLRILRQKAADRNPDEFHFAMMSSRTKGGIKIADRGNKALDMDTVKLLKTQDVGYLRTMRERVRREKERQERQIIMLADGKVEDIQLDSANVNKKSVSHHKIFVQDKASQIDFEAEQLSNSGDEGFQDSEESAGGRIEKRNIHQDEDIAKRKMLKKKEREKLRQLKRLESLKKQEKALADAENELEKQRARMSNSVGGVNKNGVKFKVHERKR